MSVAFKEVVEYGDTAERGTREGFKEGYFHGLSRF